MGLPSACADPGPNSPLFQPQWILGGYGYTAKRRSAVSDGGEDRGAEEVTRSWGHRRTRRVIMHVSFGKELVSRASGSCFFSAWNGCLQMRLLSRSIYDSPRQSWTPREPREGATPHWRRGCHVSLSLARVKGPGLTSTVLLYVVRVSLGARALRWVCWSGGVLGDDVIRCRKVTSLTHAHS